MAIKSHAQILSRVSSRKTKAYDFKVGDLRGIYHVQIFKEKQQRSKESNNWQ
jgi:hypothetical protein